MICLFPADYFNSPPPTDTYAVKEFFDNEELTILTATGTNGSIHFSHELPQYTEISLIFYKIPQTGTNDAKFMGNNQIGLLTLEGGMVKSIYNSVSRVFSAHSSKVIKFVLQS